MTDKVVKKKKKRDTSNDYVDNEKLVAAIVEYKQLKREAEEKNEKVPQMSNYIGECILQISTRLSRRPNFIGYSFRSEMISDGVENTLKYITNFDPEISSNAFSYITQICFFAFVRRITTEKKQAYIKYRAIEEAGYHGLFNILANKKDIHDNTPEKKIIEYLQLSADDVLNIKNDSDRKKKKKKKKTLDNKGIFGIIKEDETQNKTDDTK